ncbi:hypothetical protein FKM82_018977 [Ascaphus truei]
MRYCLHCGHRIYPAQSLSKFKQHRMWGHILHGHRNFLRNRCCPFPLSGTILYPVLRSSSGVVSSENKVSAVLRPQYLTTAVMCLTPPGGISIRPFS